VADFLKKNPWVAGKLPFFRYQIARLQCARLNCDYSPIEMC
jgi:hypothetical protein